MVDTTHSWRGKEGSSGLVIREGCNNCIWRERIAPVGRYGDDV